MNGSDPCYVELQKLRRLAREMRTHVVAEDALIAWNLTTEQVEEIRRLQPLPTDCQKKYQNLPTENAP